MLLSLDHIKASLVSKATKDKELLMFLWRSPVNTAIRSSGLEDGVGLVCF